MMIMNIVLYAVCSALGLLFLKLGASKGFELSFLNNALTISLNIYIIIGVIFYIVSFTMSLIIMKNANLSYFYPIATGMAYILVCVAGVLILKEKIIAQQVVGMAIILLGILVMNFKR